VRRLAQVVILSLKCQGGAARFAKAVRLAREIVCDSVFTAERLAIAANNLLNDIPETKREGELVAQCGLRETLYRKEGSNHRACNVVRQHRFLTRLVARLESEPDAVVAEIEAMRASLTPPGGIMLQVVGNMRRLAAEGTHPLYPIVKAFPAAAPPVPVMQPGQVRLARELHAPAVGAPDGTRCSVLAMAAIESCFLYSAAPGLPSFQHTDTAPNSMFLESGQYRVGSRRVGDSHGCGVGAIAVHCHTGARPKSAVSRGPTPCTGTRRAGARAGDPVMKGAGSGQEATRAQAGQPSSGSAGESPAWMLQRITTGFTSLTRLERLLQVVQLSDIGEHVFAA